MLIRMGMGTQLSGSVGGVVASRNKGGAYLRGRSVPTNPNSARQQAARTAFGNTAIAWRSLASGERESWENYAAATPIVNRIGESITVSGFGMYMRTGAFLGSTGLTIADPDQAPVAPGLCSLGLISSCAILDDGGAAQLSIVTAGLTALAGVAFFYGPAVSAGVSSFSGPYTLAAVDSAPTDVLAQSAVVDLSVLRYGRAVPGSRRPVRVAGIDAAGRLSDSASFIVTVDAV